MINKTIITEHRLTRMPYENNFKAVYHKSHGKYENTGPVYDLFCDVQIYAVQSDEGSFRASALCMCNQPLVLRRKESLLAIRYSRLFFQILIGSFRKNNYHRFLPEFRLA